MTIEQKCHIDTFFLIDKVKILLKKSKNQKYNGREIHERDSKNAQPLLVLQLTKTQSTPQPHKIK